MPLIAGPLAPVLPEAPTPPTPPVQPPVVVGPSTRTPKRLVWTSAAGDELELSDQSQGYFCQPGRAGFGMPAREVLYDVLPTGGAALRTIHDLVRVMSMPIRVQGTTQEEYLARLARLQAACRHPVRDGAEVPGVLRVELPDGSRREIRAFYNGGLDGEEDPLDDLLLCSQPFPRFELLALDPYWTGGAVSASWTAQTPPAFFGTMPRRLSPSQVLGAVSVVLPGDADAYPVWTVVGPGTPTFTHTTSGREFAFATEIPDGTTVTIDTRPEQLTVVDDTDVDWWGDLVPFPDLWSLEPGLNAMTVDMAGADSGSSISMQADVRHQTGW